VHSIAGSVLDRRQCARAHLIALKTHGAAGEAMAARATRALRADKACARLCPDRCQILFIRPPFTYVC
jgi:hypothetical protein